MSKWTQHRVLVAVPATDRTAAAKLWRFLDPDEGGELTFSEPNYRRDDADWHVACTQLERDTWAALRTAKAAELQRKARARKSRQRRGEALPAETDISRLHARLWIRRVLDGENPVDLLTQSGFTPIIPPDQET